MEGGKQESTTFLQRGKFLGGREVSPLLTLVLYIFGVFYSYLEYLHNIVYG